MKFANEKKLLPAFPRTPHMPHQPNATSDDPIAEAFEVSGVFTNQVNIEEKLDGASVGVCLHDGHPLIRNRDHIINKGYYKDTAAKAQFRPIWNWFYENKDKFAALNDLGPYSVFGEWCLAQHGIIYNRLPDWFIAYDLYDYEKEIWVASPQARKWLGEIGFTLPRLHHQGDPVDSYDQLTAWANLPAEWADVPAEGIYVKVYDDVEITGRFKMVRSDFIRGAFWDFKEMKKNKRV